jgi:hypothetical protein
MKKARLNRRETSLKFMAVVVAAMIVISSLAMIEVIIDVSHENKAEPRSTNQSYQSHPCKVSSVPAQGGLWISFDSSAPGTPAEAHVTVSDTSGITIVADFHGFWRNNYTLDSTLYDDLDMPGAGSIQEYGKPMLPCLFEYVQIPYDVDVSVDLLVSTSANDSGYEIRPAPLSEIPYSGGKSDEDSIPSTPSPTFFDAVYQNNTFFPGEITNTEGEMNFTSMIMRGHRLLGLSFFPVQYNPATSELSVFSQIMAKVKYSFPAQIEPVPERLRSELFERILEESVLNCYPYIPLTIPAGAGTTPWIVIPNLYFGGAEYLIITTSIFKEQAERLAEWKERKGMLSAVHVVPDDTVDVRQHVKDFLNFVYYRWFPAPTYILLMGDVESIPANYDINHEGKLGGQLALPVIPDPDPEHGNIASDLGYFNIEGKGYFPDMIYSRISVDTERQAEIIVNKTLLYEQTPPVNAAFYKSYLSAGLFSDEVNSNNQPIQDGIEDVQFQFIYTLERIRNYLNNTLEYNAHINYSAWNQVQAGGVEPEYFQQPVIPLDPTTKKVVNVLPEEFVWLWGYDWSNHYGRDFYYELERRNVTPNFNEGRFLVLYYGHGGSKNMYNPINMLPGYSPPEYRDITEGWHHPCLNTSFFSDLTNGNLTPLVISIACDTGWFDGETDQEYLYRDDIQVSGSQNAFAECASECFAENITRLEGGGAIAVIASSRQAYAGISAYLLNGLIQAFWPGFLGSRNQPIYEMGGALLFSKLYAVNRWTPREYDEDKNQRRTTFEEYQLFGDPETQLWTDVPKDLFVMYPDRIGIGEQKFVVTVTTDFPAINNSMPISNAKVCLQKGSDIYQVGYTDSQGQVVFNVHPSYPGMMNLTVTAHNYIPHIGEMECVCSGAALTLTPEEGPWGSSLRLNVHGFYDNENVEIYYESLHVQTLIGGTQKSEPAPKFRFGFVNIIAEGADSNLVAVALYRCYPSNPRPDPYIYSQWDETTWGTAGITGSDIRWYNPDIVIFNGLWPVSLADVSPTTTYNVRITVHNQGDTGAIDTKVTLRSAPIGGGVSWSYVGEGGISSISVDDYAFVYIQWRPPSEGEYCLKAIIDNTNDKNLDNNIGVLAVHVIEYSSPAATNFIVGNPTASDNYVFISVRQKGNHSNVWNAAVMHYSSHIINSTLNESITIQIDPGLEIMEDEWRIFLVDVYVNYQLVGGVSFNVSKAQTTGQGIDLIFLVIIGGAGVAVTLIAYVVFKKRK